MGAQARVTAPALGEETVSTTRNQTSGNGSWMWLEIVALVSPQPAAPFWPRLLLRDRVLAHYPSDPRRSIFEVPSPSPSISSSGESCTPSVSSACSRPLWTTD